MQAVVAEAVSVFVVLKMNEFSEEYGNLMGYLQANEAEEVQENTWRFWTRVEFVEAHEKALSTLYYDQPPVDSVLANQFVFIAPTCYATHKRHQESDGHRVSTSQRVRICRERD